MIDEGDLEISDDFDDLNLAEMTFKFETPPYLEIYGYDTESDDSAHLCCSECGERVELVTENASILGGICGCRETPNKWKCEPMNSDR